MLKRRSEPRGRYSLLVVAVLFLNNLFAQETDIVRLEYTYIPQSQSDNTINRFRAFVNYPIKLDDNGSYLVPGVEYRNIDLDIEDPVPFRTRNLERFQMFRVALGYTFKMNEKWRIGVKAGAEIASNFQTNSVTGRDLSFTGAGYFIKDNTGDEVQKPSRLILGLHYSTNAGRPFPLPVINYYKLFHPNWSYSLGTPKTNLKYLIGEKHALQAMITLDGSYANLQKDLIVPSTSSTADARAINISMTVILGGLGYEYFFTDHILYYLYVGYTGYNEIRLRDEDRNNLYTFNEANTYYMRTGFKLKI